MLSRLPTAKEINVFDSVDEHLAVEHFLGKTLEQAEALFRDDFHCYQEDLMWMGPKAFRFYVHAAINFLLAEKPDRGPEDIGSFCAVVAFHLDCETAEIEAVGQVIREGLLKILDTFERYGNNREIYGDLSTRYRALISRLVT